METVWKNIVIDITVLFTMVIVVSCIVFILNGSTPVWADTSTDDVYEIPEDYESRNFIVQLRKSGESWGYFYKADGSDTEKDDYTFIDDVIFDFTAYYPKNMDCVLGVSNYNGKSSVGMYFMPSESNEIAYGFALSTNLKFDVNGVYKVNLKDNASGTSTDFYIKKNNCTKSSNMVTTSHGRVNKESTVNLSIISETYNFYNCDLFSVNYPFYLGSGSSYYVYSGVLKSNFMIQQFSDYRGAIKFCEKYTKVNASGVFPEPELDKVLKRSSSLACYYKFPTQNRVPNFSYVYPKIYIKESGKDWVEYPEEYKSTDSTYNHVFNFYVDGTSKSIWGSLMFNALYLRMGYTLEQITADDFEPPKIEGIIWGVQYGYALTQNILDESSIRKSKIVFSRYVFEENIVDTPDVSIGDLGDLPNISGSTSNIEVGTGDSGLSGGSLNRPIGGHDVSDYDSTSFIDLILNGKLSFSSIGDALSSLFSMVSGFASAVGSILAAVFGNAFGLIALCAVGAVIVLRVLGR